MRLLGTIENAPHAKRFSEFLTSKGIANHVDMTISTDWGSDNYGTPLSHIWVIQEDQVAEAKTYFENFQKNPDSIEPTLNEPYESLEKKPLQPPSPKEKAASSSEISSFIILLCSIIFSWQMLTIPPQLNVTSLPMEFALNAPPITKNLLYDYPKPLSVIDNIAKTFGRDSLLNPKSLPPEGLELLQKYQKSTIWPGAYTLLIAYFKGKPLPPFNQEELFEKIREGEWWRLVTPIFLHANIFHIFFNMIWLLILGIQMERALSRFQYIIFIILTAIASNTAQYLMTGFSFLGYSGVIVAMIGFIWARQTKAPWEGYFLDRSTLLFILIMLIIMLSFSVISFFSEIYFNQSAGVEIANSAHFTGGVLGYILGQMKFFKRKQF